jgi:hypothetical protein
VSDYKLLEASDSILELLPFKDMYNPDEPWRTYVGILFDEIS